LSDTFKNTCDFLNKYSERIWNRIRLARRRKQRVSETTITENLIFDFWCHGKEDSLAIEIYEAKDEASNGNDLEIYIETTKGFLMMVCQAKIIDKANKYAGLNHKVGSEYQIDLLIKYGRKMGAMPFYLFYNYVDVFSMGEALRQQTKYRSAQFGLTCCQAEYIKGNFYRAAVGDTTKTRVTKPKFSDLHPLFASPLAEKIEIFSNDYLAGMLDDIGNLFGENPVKFYSRDQITNNNGWDDLLPYGKIGFVETEKKQPVVKKATALEGFNPKYRILLVKEVQRHGLFRIS
jgi:hypothetical protein